MQNSTIKYYKRIFIFVFFGCKKILTIFAPTKGENLGPIAQLVRAADS